MLVGEVRDEVFQDQVLKEEACHFQVIDGELANGEEVDNVRWPGHTPEGGVEVIFATEPDAPTAIFGSITEANIVGPAGYQLGAQGGSIGNQFENGAEVLQCMVGFTAFGDLDMFPFVAGGVVLGEELVQG